MRCRRCFFRGGGRGKPFYSTAWTPSSKKRTKEETRWDKGRNRKRSNEERHEETRSQTRKKILNQDESIKCCLRRCPRGMWQVTFPAGVAWTTNIKYQTFLPLRYQMSVNRSSMWVIGWRWMLTWWINQSVSRSGHETTQVHLSLLDFITVCNGHCLFIFDTCQYCRYCSMYHKIIVQGLHTMIINDYFVVLHQVDSKAW